MNVHALDGIGRAASPYTLGHREALAPAKTRSINVTAKIDLRNRTRRGRAERQLAKRQHAERAPRHPCPAPDQATRLHALNLAPTATPRAPFSCQFLQLTPP